LKSFTRRVRDLDRALFRVLFGLKWAPLTAVMRAFTVVGTAGALWGFLAALAFLFTGLEPPRLLIPWAAVAASWTVAEGAKYLFDRARPFMWDSEIAPLTKTPSSSSFPSGHSATAAAGALTLSVLYPPFAPALVLAGALVVISCHHWNRHRRGDTRRSQRGSLSPREAASRRSVASNLLCRLNV
jgi:undecaprenyl-diphosphatase